MIKKKGFGPRRTTSQRPQRSFPPSVAGSLYYTQAMGEKSPGEENEEELEVRGGYRVTGGRDWRRGVREHAGD